MIHKLWSWLRVVCSFDTHDVCQNNLIISAVSQQPMAQSHLSIFSGLACKSSSTVTILPHITFRVLHVPYKLLPICTNVSGGSIILLPALLRWAFFPCNCHQLVLKWCCRHLYGCSCLCCREAGHCCSAWTIPYNVPYLMASEAFLSMTVAMLPTLQTTAIALTAGITGLPGVPGVRWIAILAFRPQLWEYGCLLRIVFCL